MCGRYALNISGDDLAIEFAAGVKDAAFTPSNWNISPTTEISCSKLLSLFLTTTFKKGNTRGQLITKR